MKIDIVLEKGAFLPSKAFPDDAGFDIRAPRLPYRTYYLPAHGRCFIDSGVRMAIPSGMVGMIKSRSGMYKNKAIRTEGVIDSGYTGTIGVTLYNDSGCDYVIEAGDKVAQLVLLKLPEVMLGIVDSLDENSMRGSGGFGSTGV